MVEVLLFQRFPANHSNTQNTGLSRQYMGAVNLTLVPAAKFFTGMRNSK